jgi:hypothetical protein
MQIVLPASNSKKRQFISIVLTILGMILFVFGGSKAISQSDDKQYVEGKPWQQQVDTSSLVSGRYSGLAEESTLHAATDTVEEPTVLPHGPSDSAPKENERTKAKATGIGRNPGQSKKLGSN